MHPWQLMGWKCWPFTFILTNQKIAYQWKIKVFITGWQKIWKKPYFRQIYIHFTSVKKINKLLARIYNDFKVCNSEPCQACYIQPGPSMTFLVYSDPSKTVYSDPHKMVGRITINRFRRITINQERHWRSRLYI